MEQILLSPISLTDFEALIKSCVKSELQNLTPPATPKTEFLTRATTAKLLGVSLPTLHDWSKRGLITSYRIGTRVRYKKDEVESALHKVPTLKHKRGF